MYNEHSKVFFPISYHSSNTCILRIMNYSEVLTKRVQLSQVLPGETNKALSHFPKDSNDIFCGTFFFLSWQQNSLRFHGDCCTRGNDCFLWDNYTILNYNIMPQLFLLQGRIGKFIWGNAFLWRSFMFSSLYLLVQISRTFFFIFGRNTNQYCCSIF